MNPHGMTEASRLSITWPEQCCSRLVGLMEVERSTKGLGLLVERFTAVQGDWIGSFRWDRETGRWRDASGDVVKVRRLS